MEIRLVLQKGCLKNPVSRPQIPHFPPQNHPINPYLCLHFSNGYECYLQRIYRTELTGF